MKHKQNAMWRLAICLMAVGCVGLAEPFAIESFDGTGQLTFTAPDDGTNYLCQVEWAPSPAGPWSSFEGAGKEWLDAIRAVSGGAVTSSVPMCYRVVASPGDYLVVDLSGGVMAGSWPVAYYRSLRDVPDGQQHVRYKTTHLLLRRIRKGVAMMGRHPDDYWYGAGESPRHPVTLTRDFYIGVYEVTQRQWEQVMVTNPSFYTNALYSATRPVEQVNYYAIRENAAAKLIGICFFDVAGVCVAGGGHSRRNAAELSPAEAVVGLSGLVGGRPPAPKGGRSLQQGRSEGRGAWNRRVHRPSRMQFTVEPMPRLTRGAAAPPVPLALSLSP